MLVLLVVLAVLVVLGCWRGLDSARDARRSMAERGEEDRGRARQRAVIDLSGRGR